MGKTVEALEREIIKKFEGADSWDITTIIWGFSRFKGYRTKDLFKDLENKCLSLIDEMNNYELSILFRSYVETENGSKEFFVQVAKEIDGRIDNLNYLEVATIMYYLTNIAEKDFLEVQYVAELLQRLKIRLDKLKMLQTLNPKGSESAAQEKNLIEDVDFYLQNNK